MRGNRWQVQEAKQRFSALVRAASDGPQFVTKHGRTVAVVLDLAEFERLEGSRPDFKAFLASGPDVARLIERTAAIAPLVELPAS